FAALVRCPACTWRKRQRPIDDANNVRERNLRWRLCECVAAMLAAMADDEILFAQFEQDVFEEPARNILPTRNVADERRTVPILEPAFSGEINHGAECVFRFVS